MTKVLFVDDESRVLRGIQRLLWNLDSDWKAEFASSAEEALSVLAASPFDVVVSDMRMPGMDGAALLHEVRIRYPNIIRMVLSGHSDRELVMRSVSAAHCYLSKPCDPDYLQSVITRAITLRRVLTNSTLRSLVSRLDNLPSVPRCYQEVIGQLEANNVSLRNLGDIVSQDIGMTAKILQLVNSSFFGVPRHVSNPADAVCLLGIEVLKTLILTVHIFSELASDTLTSLELGNLWEHSIQSGALAKKIAAFEGVGTDLCDNAFMAGLLHDSGKLILAVNLPKEYAESLRLVRSKTMSPTEAELRMFGAGHAEVGAYLLGIWGLPDAIVEAIAFHHRPSESPIGTFAPATAVHVANAIEHAQHTGNPGAIEKWLDWEHLTQLGLNHKVPVWQEFCLAPSHA